jgi:tripartite-type tricarboxylate transporter receptor subunit TctC
MIRLLSGASVLACAISGAVHAQGAADVFPSKPVRIIVGNAPGGGVDTVSRLVAGRLTERWKYPVVVENRAGASGRLAQDEVAKSAPDGHTLLLGGNSLVIGMLLKRIPFDIRKVYDPIVQLTTQSYLLVAHPSVPVTTVKELVAYAKSRPGVLNHGTAGPGSLAHLGMSLFDVLSGTHITHIPYKGGGPAMVDLLSGRTQVLLGPSVSVMNHVRGGKLKLLAVSAEKRLSSMPDLPTIAESGVPGYELSNTYGFYAPAGTPSAATAIINRESNVVIRTPEFIARLAADGVEAAPPNTAVEYRNTIEREYQKWDRFFKTPGLNLNSFLEG